ncbi:hypothetical protein BDV96DRAFT_193375 [Lophiotrema nucula]|uniref:Initiation factor eIF2 gamma C-terminal domain-containing protein n=1 Tax=Lophiotrema nucula TaxID=690887 RepID=A0A6A5YXT3_9PLEO|nr:hypothetical protein BDV96DRAFT_193375 [Lophiotrema nucula]
MRRLCLTFFPLTPSLDVRQCRGVTYRPLKSRVKSLMAEGNALDPAVPGGLIAVGTNIAPELCRGDGLVGQVLGARGSLPPVFIVLKVKIGGKDMKLSKNDTLLLNINSSAVRGTVKRTKDSTVKIELAVPICVDVGEEVTISRLANRERWFVGRGTVVGGKEAEKGEVE